MPIIGESVWLPDAPLAHREFERHARLAPRRTALTVGPEDAGPVAATQEIVVTA